MSAPTRFRAQLPRGWRPLTGPGVAVVARPADGSTRGGVATNLLLAHDVVDPGSSLEELAAAAASRAGRGAEVSCLASGVSSRTGCERAARVLAFDWGDRGVAVAQVLALVAPAGSATVVQFVGTCAFEELPRYAPDFAAVVDSIVPVDLGCANDART